MRQELHARGFDGLLVQPGDDGYDAARTVWNAMIDRRPAVIARCRSAADVAAAVGFGRERGLEIGVRCGGHSVLGICVPDGGLMIDLTGLQSVRVDPDSGRAWVQGGAALGNLDRATQQFGLATTAGNVSHTGVGGLTLGGGMGWLAREFGLACDNVVAFEVVTADGATVRASESENADLFWGLRGGGGNFGIVTEFEFRLHRIGTAALLADYFFSPAEAPAALRRWRDLIADAPTRATLTAWVGTSGEWPFLPRALHNRPLASAGFVWVGDPDEGRRLLPSFSNLGNQVAERVERLTYLDLQSMDDEVHRHGLRRRYWKGHYLAQLPDASIDAFLAQGTPDADPDRSMLPGASLQSYGGAIASPSDDQSAFSNRDAMVEFVAAAAWTDPAEDEQRIAAARRVGAALEPYASGVYVNVLGDEGEEGVRRAYGPDKLARLAALKHRYDPDNVFHLNHNIRPRAGSAS
ncbi:MAG TPA: FAD-binding oxidoreductase [Jiangellaceae bacterium]|nr:FAD-binding oxidoreductase [Jiangellaceae bacterium]